MRDEKTQIGLLLLVSAFFLILLLFRKIICYPFCSLEKYAGKRGKGKSNNILLLHLIISLAFTLTCYYLLSGNKHIEPLFENTLTRLGSVMILWMFWGFLSGWLIERYLESTDEDYRSWKKSRGNKQLKR